MVSVPTERRYEKHIETELNNLIDDGLQFHSKTHKKEDTWYDVTRRETIESAEAAIDGSIEHYEKRLDFLKGPKVVKTFK